ncbi:MAG: hypothetical protein O7G31_02815 [Calditrichaeota bacterium]|nr:hypothetical protein [Calditrichota bacterium]
MDDYGVSLGVPNTGKIAGVGERTFKNQPQTDKKKRKKKQKSSLITKPDQVTISHPEPTKDPGEVQPGKEKNDEKQLPDDDLGHIIDVKA